MDITFFCAECEGTLIAHQNLRGSRAICAHCDGDVELNGGRFVTESIANLLLADFPPEVRKSKCDRLRRVRLLPRHAVESTSLSTRRA